MPIQLACKCGKRLKVKDELAGKSIRCPGCKALLRVPGGKPPKGEVETPDEEQEEGPSRKKRGQKWRTPSLGMTLTFFGWSSWAGGVGLMLLAFAQLLLSVMVGRDLALFILWNQPVALLIIVLVIAGEAAALAGYATCILVPKKTGARLWITLALGLAILKIAVRLFAYFSRSPGESPIEANTGLMLLGILLGVAEWVVLLVFLRMIAFDRYANWLLRSITQLMFLSIGACVCMGGLLLWMKAAAQGTMLDDTTRIVYPRALALMGLAFCGLAGYLIFRQILLLQAGRALFVEAATGTGRKSIER